MVAANLARHLREQFADKPATWKPLSVLLARRHAQRLHGDLAAPGGLGRAATGRGLQKSWRRHVIDRIEAWAHNCRCALLCGPTGSAKNARAAGLAARGAQVLDLEACARHRGSVLGAWPGVDQPSQTAFRPCWCRRWSRWICSAPLLSRPRAAASAASPCRSRWCESLRASPCIEIQASPAARLAFLLRDYANLGDDRALAGQLGTLRELHGGLTITRWQGWAAEGALEPLFAELMARHYDPLYERFAKHAPAPVGAARNGAEAVMTPAGIEALAGQVLALALTPEI